MRRVAQAPSHYEVELHQDGQAGTAWRAVRRIGANGIVPLKFASPEARKERARKAAESRWRNRKAAKGEAPTS